MLIAGAHGIGEAFFRAIAFLTLRFGPPRAHLISGAIGARFWPKLVQTIGAIEAWFTKNLLPW